MSDRFQFQKDCVRQALRDLPGLVLNVGCLDDQAQAPANSLKPLDPKRVINCDISAVDEVYDPEDEARIIGTKPNAAEVLFDAARDRWPFEDDSAALVVLGDILEHLSPEDIHAALTEARRVGQRVCITVPEDTRPSNNPERADKFRRGHVHRTIVTEALLRRALRETGWRVKQFQINPDYDNSSQYWGQQVMGYYVSAERSAGVKNDTLHAGVTTFDQALAWLASTPAFTIVQIGAFTGDTPNDPLYRFLSDQLPKRPESVVVLVEPVNDYFQQLQAVYARFPQVKCENVAIAESAGERDFFRLGVNPVEHGRTEYLAQLGSLREDRMTTLWEHPPDPGLLAFWQEHQVVERVRCVTINELLAAHHLTRVDLLQVDAEGYDYEILRSLDFARVRPRFINYERRLLYDDEPACREMLMNAGYGLMDWGAANDDTFCVSTSLQGIEDS